MLNRLDLSFSNQKWSLRWPNTLDLRISSIIEKCLKPLNLSLFGLISITSQCFTDLLQFSTTQIRKNQFIPQTHKNTANGSYSFPFFVQSHNLKLPPKCLSNLATSFLIDLSKSLRLFQYHPSNFLTIIQKSSIDSLRKHTELLINHNCL